MLKKYLFSLIIFFFSTNFTILKPAYQIFDLKGKATTYEKLKETAQKADVVLFGELHNNPICHWLQLQLLKDLHKELKNSLILGAEMFEADDQIVLNEYLQTLITEKHLEKEAKLWDNYKTDYKPLLDYALQNKIPFIATNIPRRYASIVSKKGLEFLEKNIPEEAKKYIAPLPIQVDVTLPNYTKMLEMMPSAHPEVGQNFIRAQAIKDATMAHFILKNWQPKYCFLHFNGTYHSNNFEGIVWYLKKANPTLKICTIASVEQTNISQLTQENLNLADFTIAIPEDMTKTY
ncbi:MAG: ChaN family lipoprotein [Microscillaceae bacterium]|nr:ChaN family lipoprotein [Microscillaceae bacterium]MDW8460975.1 ChaN family lipoprotein [Cytophagales bacterium]